MASDEKKKLEALVKAAVDFIDSKTSPSLGYPTGILLRITGVELSEIALDRASELEADAAKITEKLKKLASTDADEEAAFDMGAMTEMHGRAHAARGMRDAVKALFSMARILRLTGNHIVKDVTYTISPEQLSAVGLGTPHSHHMLGVG